MYLLLLAYSVKQSPFSEANQFSAGQEIPRILWNPNVPSHLHLSLPGGLFPSDFPTETLNTPLLSPIRSAFPTHYNSRFYHPNSIGLRVQIIKPLINTHIHTVYVCMYVCNVMG